MSRTRTALHVLLALLFLMAAQVSLAQPKTPAPNHARAQRITGVVVDADSGRPLGGVLVQAATARTSTNAKGRFTLTLPGGKAARLTFSLKNYRQATKKVDGSTSAIIISLKQNQ